MGRPVITFDIVGKPSPQSGMRAVNTARGARLITAGGTNLRTWRSQVADTARHHANIHGCQTLPLSLNVRFRFPMPKSAPKHDKTAGMRHRATVPDLDKLLRGLLDGLTAGGLIADDSLIVHIVAEKIDVHNDWTGATVTITEMVPL